MALLFLLLVIHVHLVGNPDFFDGKLYPANFQDVPLLNFIVDFLIVHFQTTDDEVHRLLGFAVLLVPVDVNLVRLVRRTLQVESIGVAVDNLEHGHVLGH